MRKLNSAPPGLALAAAVGSLTYHRPEQRLNRYNCDRCHGHVITVDRERGITAATMRCVATRGCKGKMHSQAYKDVSGEPTFEWRKPTDKEYAALPKDHREYVDGGGLGVYPIQTNEQTRPQRRIRPALETTIAVREPKWTPEMKALCLSIQEDLKTRKPHLNSKERKREARQAVLRQYVNPETGEPAQVTQPA